MGGMGIAVICFGIVGIVITGGLSFANIFL